MRYVAEVIDEQDVGHIIVIKDTDNAEYCVRFEEREVLPMLQDSGVVPQQVLGLFKDGSDLCITPVGKIELYVLKLLGKPYFVMRDKLGDPGAKAYKLYGLYNVSEDVVRYSGSQERTYNIARLLLENCGLKKDERTGGACLETTPEHISLCVDNGEFQSTFLRFDIEDYNKLMLWYTKFKIAQTSGSLPQTLTVDTGERDY